MHMYRLMISVKRTDYMHMYRLMISVKRTDYMHMYRLMISIKRTDLEDKFWIKHKTFIPFWVWTFYLSAESVH